MNNSAATTRLCLKVGVPVILPVKDLLKQKCFTSTLERKRVLIPRFILSPTEAQPSIHSKKTPVSSTFTPTTTSLRTDSDPNSPKPKNEDEDEYVTELTRQMPDYKLQDDESIISSRRSKRRKTSSEMMMH
ncbi:hypothetical protein HA466_0052080 [Hirschfeldia incana]|nr:hypothetical protein HA466_0052080 [Hirschfeldia incana]KAJ0262242.1 hypothetical protein HA466_0052080 [Hirschfeldia incana]